MKKALSILIVLCTLISVCVPVCGAASEHREVIARRRIWAASTYTYADCWFYEIVLDPAYVTCENEKDLGRTNGWGNYTLEHREVDDLGLCYVIYIIDDGYSQKHLKADSFRDRDGNGNESVLLTFDRVSTRFEKECKNATPIYAIDSDFSIPDRQYHENFVKVGSDRTKITFALSGTVRYGDETMAQDVDEYTLEYTEPGVQELVLSVKGLTVGSYKIHAMTAEQIEGKIAELKEKRREVVKSFFVSLPLSLITLPLALFALLGFALPFAPFEIGPQFFQITAVIRELRAML